MSNPAGSNGQQAVLLVDDDELCRSSVRALLESNGFEVVAVEDGESAIEAFDLLRESIAVVLLDVVLPGLSGVDTLRALRESRHDLPVVLTSGYDEDAISADFTELQYAGFVSKPGSPQKLAAILRSFTET